MSLNEVGDYLQARNFSIESLSYVWKKAKPQLETLLAENEKILDPSSFKHVKIAYELLSDGIIQSILEEKEIVLKTIDAIKQRELYFFKNITLHLPDIFTDLFYAYLENSEYTQKGGHISKLSEGFAKYNIDLRYPSMTVSNSPKRDANVNKNWQWQKSNELLQCYPGIVSIVQSVRNSMAHIIDIETRNLLKKLDREITEPINSSNSSGNIFVLISMVILIIHEFREVLQTWLDTIKLRDALDSKKIKPDV